MLTIDMDNGKCYLFDDFDEYYIVGDHLVVTQGKQWLGYFKMSHLVAIDFEPNDEEEHFDPDKRIR